MQGCDFDQNTIAERRKEIDAALAEAKELIAALGPGVPRKWKGALVCGAENEWNVAQATTDQLLMYWIVLAHRSGSESPDLDVLERDMIKRDQAWKKQYPVEYTLLKGGQNIEMLSEIRVIVSQ